MASVTQQALLMRGAHPFGAACWHFPLSVVAEKSHFRQTSWTNGDGAWLAAIPYAASNVPKSVTWQQPLSKAAAVAKIVPTWSFVPFNTAQVVGFTNVYFQPLSVPNYLITKGRRQSPSIDVPGFSMAWIEGIPLAQFQLSTAIATTLSGGNLVATSTSSATNQGARLNNAIAKSTGKYYFEITLTNLAGGGATTVGIGTITSNYTNLGADGTSGATMEPSSLGQIFSSGSSIAGLGTRATGDVIGIAVDLDNKLAWFRVAPSGNWNGIVGNDPTTATGGVSVPAGLIVPFVTFNLSSNVFTGNFGASAFTGAVPSAFTSGWTPAAGSVITGSTLNSSDKSANVTLSNGNLTASFSSASDGAVRSVSSKTSGKYYVEFIPGGTWSGADNGFGIALAAANLGTVGTNAANAAAVFAGTNPPIYYNGAFSGTNLAPTGLGTLVSMAVDLDNKKIWFRNWSTGNKWNGNNATNDPGTNLGGLDISALFPGVGAFVVVCADQSGASATVNFGSSVFAQTVPSGFTAGWPA